MEGKAADEKITEWMNRGILTKESILGILYERIQGSSSIDDDERSALATTFQSACDSDGHLTEASFNSLLHDTSSLTPCQESNAGFKMILESIAYLSTLPFPERPLQPTPEHLSLPQLTRGLVWGLPGRYRYIIEQGGWSRMRTDADHRRLLFQSLASLYSPEPHYDTEAARKLALRNALDVDEFWQDIAVCNHDPDGDEIYHDLLDVLYSSQEIKHELIAGVHRNGFRAIAKTIAITETNGPPPKLQHLAISPTRFTSLLTLLLALQFQPDNSTPNPQFLSQFEPSARFLCNTFTDPTTGLVTWPMFDHGLKSVAPYLFDPFYKLLGNAFLKDRQSTQPHSSFFAIFSGGFTDLPTSFLPETETVVTLPVIAQLVCFLGGSAIYTPIISRVRHHSFRSGVGGEAPPSSVGEFVTALETVPDELFLFVSGRVGGVGERVIFGVFSPKPSLDGGCIQVANPPNHVGKEGCAVFQIAPRQDLFRGVVGRGGW